MSRKNIKKDIPCLIGIVCSAALACITGGNGMILSTINSICGGFASNLLSNIFPDTMKSWFIHTHPNDLNHSIKKLFIKSINDALENILVLFSEANAEKKVAKKEARKLVKTMQKHLPNMLWDANQMRLGESEIKHFLYEKDEEENICKLVETQFEIFGMTEPFKSFFAQNLPTQIQLCFGEGLKKAENNDAWIAFQRMLIEEIRNSIKQIFETQQSIKEDLSDLKLEKSNLSEEQISEIKQLIRLLNDKKLVEVKVRAGINNSLNSIEAKANQIIAITTNIDITVNELKTLIAAAKRQNYITHIGLSVLALLVVSAILFVTYKFISQPFTAKIQIVDWKGRDNEFIKDSDSQITIWLGDKKLLPKSVMDGIVEFSDIPVKYNGIPIRIDLLAKQKYFKIIDSVITLKKGELSILKIFVIGLDQIHGYVKDEHGIPIENASISVFDLHTYSDRFGYYNILIPPEKQETEQRIIMQKDGFIKEEMTVSLVNQICDIEDICLRYNLK